MEGRRKEGRTNGHREGGMGEREKEKKRKQKKKRKEKRKGSENGLKCIIINNKISKIYK